MSDKREAAVTFLNKQKLVEELRERHTAVMELLPTAEHPQIKAYLEGQTYVLKRLLSDLSVGCFDAGYAARDEEVERLREAEEIVDRIRAHWGYEGTQTRRCADKYRAKYPAIAEKALEAK